MRSKLLLALTLLLLLSACASPEPASDAPSEALTALETENRALREQIDALQHELASLTALPPLTESGTILVFGDEQRLYTDGAHEYLHCASFLASAGLDKVDAELREHEGETYLLLQDAAEAAGAELDATAYGVRFLARRVEVGAPTPGYHVPTLMYHAVSDDVWGIPSLFLSPESLEAQLQYLTENGYDAIWFSDLAHLEDYDKPVLLTFDDGYADNYETVFPLLQKYGVKATYFIVGLNNGSSRVTPEQITELSRSGLVSIQCHGLTHHPMGDMHEATLDHEFLCASKILASLTGEYPYVVSYPTGNYSDGALATAAHYFAYGTRTNGMLFDTTQDDPYLVPRYNIPRGTSLETFAGYLLPAGKVE